MASHEHLSTPVLESFGSYPAAQLFQVRVLVVDDDPPIRQACVEISTSLGFPTQSADSVPSARSALQENTFDLVLLDLKLPGGGGLVLLEEIRTQFPDTAVVVMTAFATVSSAVEAMRMGAADYLTKPFTFEELNTVLEQAVQRSSLDIESRALRDRLRTGKGLGNLIGRSPAMERLYRILSKVAKTNHPVLIVGESGVGKESVARSIHINGPHAEEPFVPVDCGSAAPALLESELFGHVKGAFAGATRSKIGLLAAAEGGTLFLNEIDALPLDLQGKLWRALQEREIRPVGGTAAVPLNVRLLAATTRDLAAMVEAGQFRKDLYFRLNIVSLHIPPLRERKADIPLLAAHALDRIRRESGQACTFADNTLRLLMDYDWPGNVRELENAIEHACALAGGAELRLADFPAQLQSAQPRAGQHETASKATPSPSDSAPLQITGEVISMAELEKQAILNTIRHLKGDKLLAAKKLGIGKTTLYRKLKQYGLGDSSIN